MFSRTSISTFFLRGLGQFSSQAGTFGSWPNEVEAVRPTPTSSTPAEWRVLDEVRTGATNAEVAVRLGIGLATVKFHIRNIRRKLNVSDRDELAAWKGEPRQEPTPRPL